MLIDSSFSGIMERVFSGHPFSREEAEGLVDSMIDGRMSDVRIAAVLTGMRFGNPSAQQEIVSGGIGSVCKHANVMTLGGKALPLVDCSGVGRNGNSGASVATLASVIASASGAWVAQFGSRSLSGRCGAAELLEALEVRLAHNESNVSEDLREAGISFLYAPAFYPNLKHIAAVRKSLGFHTVFDLLFPLVNPVPLCGQLLGVFDRNLMRVAAECLVVRGRSRGLVVYAEDGADEISVCGPTHVVRVVDGVLSEELWTPHDFDMECHVEREFCERPAEECATDFVRTLKGNRDCASLTDAACVNAGAVLWCAGIVPTVKDGVRLARKTVTSGAALAKLESWRALNP
jgi:anthranilate phosphoribosyltransferase